MEDITTLLMLLSIGLFIVRYVIKRTGVNYLTVVTSVCSLAMILKDTSIPGDDLLIYMIPSVFVMMVSICAIAFDGNGE